jgi:hypothetical protein
MQNTTSNDQFYNMKKRIHEGNNVWTGLILLTIGAVFLMRKLDFPMADWLFGWETIFIIVGVIIGVRHQFRGFFWFIMILIGSVSLIDEMMPGFHIKNFAWPIILIVAGLYFILRPKRTRFEEPPVESIEPKTYKADMTDYSEAETLETTAIFGSVKKVVVSKNFRGGELVSIMGGTEINFSQADIQGRVSLEATNFMGGTKLIIPPTWDVQSEMVAIFGGVEDKRDEHSLKIDRTKVLVLEGTCIFGGLEIKSY